MEQYLWAIPLLPLLGAILNGFGALTGKLPRQVVHFIACGVVFLAFLLASITFLELRGMEGEPQLVQSLFVWIQAGSFKIDAAVLMDQLSSVMVLVITGVGFLIHLYSTGYMAHDESYARYFAYLNLFTFAMLILVMGESMPLMFVGWEGVGVCSYLLIGFWFDDVAKADAGKKAFIVNRVGDFGFVLGMFLLYWTLADSSPEASLSFPALKELVAAHPLSTTTATVVCLLLFVGATGKSAQIPLYVWLPDAMAGPTPVSALIHAATMVTAGVYMICRLNFLYLLSPTAMTVVACVGAATALYAATIGLTQTDIKKVLAYSTVSQLGYMFLAVGLGAFSAGMFHLVTHAFFKACLFLGSGSVIHACGGEQDMRRMGGLRAKLPATYWTFLLATLAISGIVGTAGFMSKDEILAKALLASHSHTLVPGVVLYAAGAVGALLTTFYMFRLVFMTFHGEYRGEPEGGEEAEAADDHGHHGGGNGYSWSKVHESPLNMTFPLMVLAFLSIFGGLLNVPKILTGGAMPEFLNHWLEGVLGEPEWGHLGHSAEIGLMVGIQVLIVATIYAAYVIYVKRGTVPSLEPEPSMGLLYRFSLNKYYIDEIYQALVVKPLFQGSRRVLWRIFDVKIIDGAVNGLAGLVKLAGQAVGMLHVGVVNTYALSIVLGMVAVLSYYALN